jgi:D-lyxose ketol-isomerase
MKRSEINAIMKRALGFLNEHRFLLPPFARWSPGDWQGKGAESAAIVEQQLGWDITDFGSADFGRIGLFLFTIRNGTTKELANPLGKHYAEKILIVEPGQVTPTHFHFQKMEDIINRGGGDLLMQLWNSDANHKTTDTAVRVMQDGVEVNLSAGDVLRLRPGDSVTLPQRLYHKFWGDPGHGTVLVGEVSRINDDRVDNYFLDSVGRFPTIDEDVPPLHLLTGDYGRYYRGGSKRA